MRQLRVTTGYAIFLIFTLSASADEEIRSPVEQYRLDTQFYMMSCHLSVLTAINKARAGLRIEASDGDSDYAFCISNGKEEAMKALKGTLPTVKGMEAQQALKDYHVAFSSALEGLRPIPGERQVDYKQRQAALHDKLNQTWTRFQIEQ